MRRALALIAVAVLLVVQLGGCKGNGPHLYVPTPPANRYTAIDPVAIQALSPNDIWVAGFLTTTCGTSEGLILWSNDSGKRWHRAGSEIHDLSNLAFTSVFFTDRVRGWIGGRKLTPEGIHRGVVFRTKDGGNHWTELVLPANDQIVVEDIHSVAFESDQKGEIVVSYRATKAAEITESVYQTLDGGRSWSVTSFGQAVKPPTDDRTLSYFNKTKTSGFRLHRSERPGVTVLEETASGGKDWMPVSELSISYIPSFY